MLVSLSTVLAAASVALALSCGVHSSKLPGLPAGVVPPTTDGPHFIGVALGVQNYTCAATGTFTYAVRLMIHDVILTSMPTAPSAQSHNSSTHPVSPRRPSPKPPTKHLQHGSPPPPATLPSTSAAACRSCTTPLSSDNTSSSPTPSPGVGSRPSGTSRRRACSGTPTHSRLERAPVVHLRRRTPRSMSTGYLWPPSKVILRTRYSGWRLGEGNRRLRYVYFLSVSLSLYSSRHVVHVWNSGHFRQICFSIL